MGVNGSENLRPPQNTPCGKEMVAGSGMIGELIPTGSRPWLGPEIATNETRCLPPVNKAAPL